MELAAHTTPYSSIELLPNELLEIFVKFINTYSYAYIYTYIYTYIYAYIHTYMHTYIHSYIHNYIRSR